MRDSGDNVAALLTPAANVAFAVPQAIDWPLKNRCPRKMTDGALLTVDFHKRSSREDFPENIVLPPNYGVTVAAAIAEAPPGCREAGTAR